MAASPLVPFVDPESPVFRAHEGGKLGVHATKPLRDRDDLSLLYTPGVAEVSLAIAADPSLSSRYTARGNTVAVISDGTAVLGLGDIGPSYGGINLEDISAPRCFDIEEQLKERLDIPVFHDDQHGTAIVVLAGLLNAVRVLDRRLPEQRVVVSGAGAAGVAVTKLLQRAGVRDVVVCDSRGIISPSRQDLTGHKSRLAASTNPRGLSGRISTALTGADVYIGVSGGTVPEDEVALMAPGGMIFALANPTPEVHPDVAHRHAAIVATGRSDFPNQINNVLAFPGIFRGALDSGAPRITEAMKLAAAHAIADLVEEPSAECIVPSVFQEGVTDSVASAVVALARSGR